jgi:hypothetical protein
LPSCTPPSDLEPADLGADHAPPRDTLDRLLSFEITVAERVGGDIGARTDAPAEKHRWRDRSRSALTIGTETATSKAPAAMSTQKWLPVSIREKLTHAGQAAHRTLRASGRTRTAMAEPMIRASAACRLGIAA